MTLVEKVLNFEELETLEDVRNYYLYDRGWINDESLVDVLTYFLINI
jgi:hypothetical protein